ncbi:MAG: hypothetical protein J6Y52_05070 [Bacteroidales bacterium]|nr:hypothetical protein [Bacteroidales bacterium]
MITLTSFLGWVLIVIGILVGGFLAILLIGEIIGRMARFWWFYIIVALAAGISSGVAMHSWTGGLIVAAVACLAVFIFHKLSE